MNFYAYLVGTGAIFYCRDKGEFFISDIRTPSSLKSISRTMVGSFISKWGYTRLDKEVTVEPEMWPECLAAILNDRYKMNRRDVYKLIDGERDYQDSMGADRTDGLPKDVGAYLTVMRHIMRNAEEKFYGLPGNHPETLDEIRKLAATAVRCMEEHNTRPRELSNV